MEERGWISSFWGESENKRRAKYYRLTRAGRKQSGSKPSDGADFLGHRSSFGSVLEAFDMPLLVKARSFVRNLLFLPAAWK